MTRPEPAWRKVACPKCGQPAKFRCRRYNWRRFWDLIEKPHAARVRLATQQPATRGEE